MNSKKDLNEKFISFLDQTKNEEHKSVTHLNDRVLIVDGLNTFIRAFAVNPSINDDGVQLLNQRTSGICFLVKVIPDQLAE